MSGCGVVLVETTWPTRMICGLGEYDELPRSPLMLMVKSMPGPCGLVAPGGVEGLVELDPHPSPSARIAVAEQSRMSRVMKTIGASADPFSERTGLRLYNNRCMLAFQS